MINILLYNPGVLAGMLFLGIGCFFVGLVRITFARSKGHAGEFAIGQILDQTGCRFIHDLTFVNKKGEICQIDFLVFLGNAIGVIEVKNYSGIITGLPTNRHWVQQTKWQTLKLYNPIKQNMGHIMKLKSDFPNIYFENIVVMVGTATIAPALRPHIIHKQELSNLVSQLWQKHGTSKRAEPIWHSLENIGTAPNARQAHKKYIQQLKFKRLPSLSSFKNYALTAMGGLMAIYAFIMLHWRSF